VHRSSRLASSRLARAGGSASTFVRSSVIAGTEHDKAPVRQPGQLYCDQQCVARRLPARWWARGREPRVRRQWGGVQGCVAPLPTSLNDGVRVRVRLHEAAGPAAGTPASRRAWRCYNREEDPFSDHQ